jgi:steroid 5-alpha reductase family enzyme
VICDLSIIIAVVFCYAGLWFVVSLVKKRNDVADIAWGLGYIILSTYTLMTGTVSARGFLVYSLVLVWGLRLAFHVASRNRGKAEDSRYKRWREEWGRYFYVRSFFQIYILQGVFMLLIWSPVYIVFRNPQKDLWFLDYLGAAIWVTGFFFESVGDYQLLKFVKDPENKGRIMDSGVWRYTRHPNYFGEITMWWGIFLIAISSVNGIYAIISPVTITYLLLFVSGIPMLERKYKGNRAYEEYQRRTSAFFPLPPKS